MPRRLTPLLLCCAAISVSVLSGCVRRTLSITSEPDGALVFLNEREVGRTPIDVEFTYYGTYDVRVLKDGYEPLVTAADAKPPIWDTIPLDLVSELIPGTHEARISWHFTLEPRVYDTPALLERARQARAATEAMPIDSPTPSVDESTLESELDDDNG